MCFIRRGLARSGPVWFMISGFISYENRDTPSIKKCFSLQQLPSLNFEVTAPRYGIFATVFGIRAHESFTVDKALLKIVLYRHEFDLECVLINLRSSSEGKESHSYYSRGRKEGMCRKRRPCDGNNLLPP